MIETELSNESKMVSCLMPGVKVYLTGEPETFDPFTDHAIFRGEECFNGSLKGWKRWVKPSPEPKPDRQLKEIVIRTLSGQAPYLAALHDRLLSQIDQKLPGKPIVLVSILRAGVFIAQGLAKRMTYFGRQEAPVTALGLFHEAGFDSCALQKILNDYPGHYPVFVDGWTGRGVVARELKRAYAEWRKTTSIPNLPKTPLLATLVDPGHHGDLWGTDKDTLIPCAYFTAPEVFGFSRAFIKDPGEMWSAYNYSSQYYDTELVNAWLNVFNAEPLRLNPEDGSPQILSELLNETACLTNTLPEQWKVNINEVVRSFVNRNPKQLILGTSESEAEQLLPSVLYLARRTSIPISYHPDWGKRHNCLAAVKVK